MKNYEFQITSYEWARSFAVCLSARRVFFAFPQGFGDETI